MEHLSFIQIFLGAVASIITSLGILWVPLKWLFLDPREKLKKYEEKEEREKMMKISKEEHEQTMAKMEETSRPHVELLQQHNERLANLEDQNQKHEFRIFTLEKESGKHVRVYEEKYNVKKEKE